MPGEVDVIPRVDHLAGNWGTTFAQLRRGDDRPHDINRHTLRQFWILAWRTGPSRSLARLEERRPVEEPVVGGDPISAFIAPMPVNRFARKTAGNLRFFWPAEPTENELHREVGGGSAPRFEQSPRRIAHWSLSARETRDVKTRELGGRIFRC